MEPNLPVTSISTIQNQPLQIKRLAAQREIYAGAKKLQAAQTVLAAIAVLGTLLAAAWSALQPALTVYGVVLTVVDALLGRQVKAAKEQAAKIQELFDCDVQQLDWNDVRLGEKPEMESVIDTATRHLATNEAAAGLTDWYTVGIGELPIWVGRLVCQRENVGWDNRLRRSYATLVTTTFAVGVLLIVAAAAVAWQRFGSSVGLLITYASLAFPAIKFGFKHVLEAHVAAKQLADLQASASRLWHAAVDRQLTDVTATHKARLFQDCLFDHRRASPLIYDWVYQRYRDPHQKGVSEVSRGLIEEARSRGHLPQATPPPQLPAS